MENTSDSEQLNFHKIWLMFQETDRKFQETDKKFQETDRKFQETDRLFRESDKENEKLNKTIKEIGLQIGGLGNKFGSFGEAIALPSMEKLLRQKFNVKHFFPRTKYRHNGIVVEYDMVGLTDIPENLLYIVEVKSHLRQKDILQVEKAVLNFTKYLPEFKGRKIYGIIAAFDYREEERKSILDRGFYFAHINDDVFILDTPQNFTPKCWT